MNEPLKNHTTYRVGGPAHYFADVHSLDELTRLHEVLVSAKVPIFVIGNGSNILVGDKGFPGCVIRLGGDFADFELNGEEVTAGAALRLGTLVQECTERELSGFECLCGVPGTVGGALISNAGSKDAWIGERVAWVETLNDGGRVRRLERGDIAFGYRSSSLERALITRACFYLKKSAKNDIVGKVEKLIAYRSQVQPRGTWNAGSVFKNPPHDSAGRLIDACGLKGLTFGGAQVSTHHANFIINTGHASASDIRTLITMVHQKVKARFGVELELEIKLIGE